MNSLSRSTSSLRLAVGPALLGLALCLGGAGCTVRTSGYADADYPVAAVETAPVNIETYPTVNYEGRVHYYANNQWYYRGGDNRWMTYRREPPALYQRRPTTVRATTVAPGPVERSRTRY